MKFRKLALVLVIVLLASTLAPALAKSPFADVPADHWAYDSIVELAAAGLIEGYPDGTYGGARMMTRYEAAMVFARALARLESRVDILPEFDRIKAELVDEIKAQLAAADAPVETVIEKVIVDKDVDEAVLARIRANEIAIEALEGDIAYVEYRVLGLVDGIRYDMNQLQEQVDGLEIPSLEEIEALIAEKIEEGLLEAARSAQDAVQEPSVIEKVVVMEAELTEEDVELIAEELITQQVQKYVRVIVDSFSEDIAALNERVEALEAAQADFAGKADLAAVKDDVDAVKADVKDLQKVKLGGTANFKVEYKKVEDEKEYVPSQSLSLNFKLKPSDTVDASFSLDIVDGKFDPKRATVTSAGPIKSLTVGKWSGSGGDVVGIGNGNVLANSGYDLAGVANLDLFEDFDATVLLGLNDQMLNTGVAVSYKLMPEFGIKAAFAAEKAPMVKPEAKAVGGGIFGKVAGVEYGANIAMNLQSEDVPEGENKENTRFDANLAFDVGPLSLDGAYIRQAENFASADAFNSIEAGVSTDFLLGIDLAGRFYRKTEEEEVVGSAYRLTANKGFELGGLPVTVDARFAGVNDPSKPEDEQDRNNLFVKLGVKKDADFRYGASVAYERHVLKDGDWKTYGNYDIDDTVATLAANVGYKFDWRGASLDLGYGAELKKPIEDLEDGEEATKNSSLVHKLTFGYDFTKDVKLTLGSTITQTLSDPVSNDFVYDAGLTISF